MEKTKSQIEKKALAYLTKTSNHVFVTESGYLYKIIPFVSEGTNYYATIYIGKDSVVINTKEVLSDRQFAYYGNNSLNVLKGLLFPKYDKTKSIPNFKKMREFVALISNDLKVDSKSNKELSDKIKDKIKEFELIK